MDEGRMRQYAIYAVGEILLVVVGILIALQINNWNEERKKDLMVSSHLKSLAKAVDQDIRELSISMQFNESRFHFLDYLLKVSNTPLNNLHEIPRTEIFKEWHWIGPYPNSDTLHQQFVNWSMPHINTAFVGMVFDYSAINEMNNLGIMSEIDDDSLKTVINEYYYHLDWRFGDQEVNRRYKLAEDLKNHLRDEHAISCTYPPDLPILIKAIKNDDKLVIMLKELIKVSHDQYWAAQGLQERAIKLSETIGR